jgi:hypothetical protein
MMRKFTKKPVEITAVEWTGTNTTELFEFCDKCFAKPIPGTEHKELIIPTLEGPMKASIGDFIIKGIKGEFYPCKSDIFWLTYDEVTN